jgi:hypothetical protein
MGRPSEPPKAVPAADTKNVRAMNVVAFVIRLFRHSASSRGNEHFGLCLRTFSPISSFLTWNALRSQCIEHIRTGFAAWSYRGSRDLAVAKCHRWPVDIVCVQSPAGMRCLACVLSFPPGTVNCLVCAISFPASTVRCLACAISFWSCFGYRNSRPIVSPG